MLIGRLLYHIQLRPQENLRKAVESFIVEAGGGVAEKPTDNADAAKDAAVLPQIPGVMDAVMHHQLGGFGPFGPMDPFSMMLPYGMPGSTVSYSITS